MDRCFIAMPEKELVDSRRFGTQAEAKLAVFEWIEGWYNAPRDQPFITLLNWTS